MLSDYFINKVEVFAKWHCHYNDSEFPAKFESFMSEFPDDKSTRKEILNELKKQISEEYINHKKQHPSPCQNDCYYAKGYYRGTPFIDAELKKIHWLNIKFDKAAEFVKNLPFWLLGKVPLLIKYFPKNKI